MRKLWLVLGLSPLLWSGLAHAQNTFTMPPPAGVTVMGIQVVTTCGTASLTNGSLAFVAMDHTGALCTNASGGGGGETNYALETGGNLATIATNTAAAIPCLNATAYNTNSYSNAQTNSANCNLNGGLFVQPVLGNNYGNQANWLSGTSGNVDNTTQTTIIAAPAGGKIYVTGVQCFNSGTTASTITLNDGAATVLLNPAGVGVVSSFQTPLIVGTTTALKFTPGSSSTHQWCNAQGYNAT
jgi:hypothetical protein